MLLGRVYAALLLLAVPLATVGFVRQPPPKLPRERGEQVLSAKRGGRRTPEENVWQGIDLDDLYENWHPRNQPPIVDPDWRSFRAELIALHDVSENLTDSYSHLNSSRWAHELGTIEMGCVLVASPTIQGEFHKSIVMILSHNRNGSYGAILNRPSQDSLAKALEKNKATKIDPDLLEVLGTLPAHNGGPVDKQMLSLLHNALGLNGSVTVIPGAPGVHVGGFDGLRDRYVSDRLLDSFRGKVIFGHAAWSPGQLAREVEAGKWWIAALSPSIIMDECDAGAEALWEEVVHMLNYPELVEGDFGQRKGAH